MKKKKGIFIDYTKKTEVFDKEKEKLQKDYEIARTKMASVLKKQKNLNTKIKKTLTLDQNKLMCSLILDIGFDFSDLTIVLGSLLKAKEVIDGADNNAKNQLINDCIARYNKFASENNIVIKGFNELEDYQKKEGQTDNNVEKP